jgi:hypothetical protein
MSSGVQLTVEMDKETISAHLGPAWYVQRQDIKIVPGDKVEIPGSRITFQRQPAIIAALSCSFTKLSSALSFFIRCSAASAIFRIASFIFWRSILS